MPTDWKSTESLSRLLAALVASKGNEKARDRHNSLDLVTDSHSSTTAASPPCTVKVRHGRPSSSASAPSRKTQTCSLRIRPQASLLLRPQSQLLARRRSGRVLRLHRRLQLVSHLLPSPAMSFSNICTAAKTGKAAEGDAYCMHALKNNELIFNL